MNVSFHSQNSRARVENQIEKPWHNLLICSKVHYMPLKTKDITETFYPRVLKISSRCQSGGEPTNVYFQSILVIAKIAPMDAKFFKDLNVLHHSPPIVTITKQIPCQHCECLTYWNTFFIKFAIYPNLKCEFHFHVNVFWCFWNLEKTFIQER